MLQNSSTLYYSNVRNNTVTKVHCYTKYSHTNLTLYLLLFSFIYCIDYISAKLPLKNRADNCILS